MFVKKEKKEIRVIREIRTERKYQCKENIRVKKLINQCNEKAYP